MLDPSGAAIAALREASRKAWEAELQRLGTGLLLAFIHAAWGSFTLTRVWLALRGDLPWRLTSFLADAHRNRGVLRQVGAGYRFRHIDIQNHLAGIAPEQVQEQAQEQVNFPAAGSR